MIRGDTMRQDIETLLAFGISIYRLASGTLPLLNGWTFSSHKGGTSASRAMHQAPLIHVRIVEHTNLPLDHHCRRCLYVNEWGEKLRRR